ncbi:MAG: flagellar motor switch protein FliG [Abditibacteriales bacterium]|nr:flagellar motor switch protein FliG [Abditibacteriales bacterium]MDW8365990.1 flagellar motor switch protein FliG [Abditibacteriales bacterium]
MSTTASVDIDIAKVSNPQKAAIILVALGSELAAEVVRHLTEAEMEKVTVEILNVGNIPREVQRAVFREFRYICQAHVSLLRGGVEYAREVLEQALGPDQADRVIERIINAVEERPFSFVRRNDPAEIVGFLQTEHPQTIALVLAHLPVDKAAGVMAHLPADLRPEVAMRIATMNRSSPEVVREVERVLRRKISPTMVEDNKVVGGVPALVDIINHSDRTTERTILETLEQQFPELADEIKKQLFVFEDIVKLDDRSIQQILREVDSKDLALALKGASDEVKQKVFRNMSERAATMLREDMEFMGPVRLRNVEEAQTKVVAVIRRLEETGVIEISRGSEDAFVT